MRASRGNLLKARFWSSVRVSEGCWEWTGTKQNRGYGHLKVVGRSQLAHRLSWEFANGPIPPKTFVLHKCDNPPCVRPDHLFLGAQKDNIEDARAKGRMATGLRNGKHTHPEKIQRGDDHWSHRLPARAARGEQVGGSRLLPEQVIEIRHRRADGWILKDLAAAYNVRIGTIHFIVTGQTWKHLL